MFFSNFCHNYHQNYHDNYHCNHHYHIKIFFGHTRITLFLTLKKEDQVARIRGMGGGNLGNYRMKTFFLHDVFSEKRGNM